MSQRVGGGGDGTSVPAHADNSSTGPKAPEQHCYPERHHLMPGSLQKIPPWYEPAHFQHNARLLAGVIPGLILLITVTGKTMVATILSGMLFTLMVRYMRSGWTSLMVTVGHVFLLEVVNVYCMAPLIWRSVLNLPLFAIFHVFIAITGIWWWLQDEEFRLQEPRFTILLERVLFLLYPAISVTMVTWVFGILFGLPVLPFIVLIAGVVAFGLYLVPLQSSFTKPNTSLDVGVIQHRVVVWLYTVLLMVLPALMFTAISHTGSLQSFLLLGLLLTSPPFLLSLLEAQGLGQWFSLGSWTVQMLRMVFGSLVMVLVSASVSLAQPSSFLPLLLLPILFVTMALAAFIDHAPLSTPTLVIGGSLAVFYIAAFTQLPWSIIHASSFLSLPLSVLQLLILAISLSAVAMITLWTKISPTVWALYNGVFVLCEFILIWDGVYPLYISMATGVVAFFTFWRLQSVGKLSLGVGLSSMCLHLTKLSLLFPCAHSPSPLTASLLPFFSTFLTSHLLLRLLVFEHTPPLEVGRLLTYSGLLFVGLLLSVDTILSPIWTSLTHTLPSSANLLATILGIVALYLHYGLSLIGSQRGDTPLLPSLPPSLGVMAALLSVLQPEFNILELFDSVVVTIGDMSEVSEEIYLTAWKSLLTWLMLFSTLFALIQLTTPHIPVLTTISTTLLGVLAGFFAALSLLHAHPGTISSLIYAAILGLGGALCGRAYSTHNKGNITDRILYSILFLFFLLSYCVEWMTLPYFHLPGKAMLEYYAKPCTSVIAVCSLLLSVIFRLKMYWKGEEPYLPILANISCLLFFVTAILQEFHHELEISVLLCSLVFLLTQPDGFVRPKKSYIFVAPCLIGSVVVLYVIAAANIIPYVPIMLQKAPQAHVVGRLTELLCIFLSIPSHFMFVYSLWTGERLVSIRTMILYLTPNCLLPQLASSTATSVLGSIGIFSFCLTIIADKKLIQF